MSGTEPAQAPARASGGTWSRIAPVVAASFVQGFLSMGFQLVASRQLAPFFGTTLFVWAFIISTFLAAFSIGALAGGACSRGGASGIARAAAVFGVIGTAGFAFTAFAGHASLQAIDSAFPDLAIALALACPLLFFVPVMALSAVLPLFIELLSRRGGGGGLSAGIIYGVSTVGNITGVMATAFLLIPNLPTSRILVLWAAAAAACFWAFRALMKGAAETT